MNLDALKATAMKMVGDGKGILAADESTPTIGKRFETINTESTEESRRRYREMLFTSEGANNYKGRKLNNELKSELSTHKNERDLIFDMNETLEEEIISIQMSDSFVESYAREKLDLVKPDEVIIEIDVTKDNPND